MHKWLLYIKDSAKICNELKIDFLFYYAWLKCISFMLNRQPDFWLVIAWYLNSKWIILWWMINCTFRLEIIIWKEWVFFFEWNLMECSFVYDDWYLMKVKVDSTVWNWGFGCIGKGYWHSSANPPSPQKSQRNPKKYYKIKRKTHKHISISNNMIKFATIRKTTFSRNSISVFKYV